jgi:hypothetical protein
MEAAASLNLGTSAGVKRERVIHALACSFDRVLWSNEVKLARVDLDNVCLIGIAPDDTSQAFEHKHGRSDMGSSLSGGRVQCLSTRVVSTKRASNSKAGGVSDE